MRGSEILRRAGGAGAALALSTAALSACTPNQQTPKGNWQPAGAALIRLARPVAGVNQDGLVIRERDSQRLIGIDLLCKSGNTDVDCSGSQINAILVLPTLPLRFGQYYQISFASRLLDSQGRTPITGNPVFRAGTTVEDTGAAPLYSWGTRSSSAAFGGSYAVESMSRARATTTFSGNSVTVWTATHSAGGLMDVYIDRVLKATYNTYSPSTHYRVPVTVGGLTNSGHQLDVVVQGVRGSSASRGSDVVIDGLSAPSGSSPNPSFEYGWGIAFSSAFSQRLASSTMTPGATVSLVFRGTSIDVATVRGPFSGIYRVVIDRRIVGDYSDASSRFGVASRHFLANGDVLHRISITALGRHTAGSVASAISVDYWQLPASQGAPALNLIQPHDSTVPLGTSPSFGPPGASQSLTEPADPEVSRLAETPLSVPPPPTEQAPGFTKTSGATR